MIGGGQPQEQDHQPKMNGTNMSDSPVYLVVTSIPFPDKMEQMQSYASQVAPLMIKGGGEFVARYGVIEQTNGEGGPKSIAVIKFSGAQGIRDTLSTDEFKALAGLRDEAFSRVDQMICTAL
jgi:uncharacterized protein (DUF1330 family)